MNKRQKKKAFKKFELKLWNNSEKIIINPDFIENIRSTIIVSLKFDVEKYTDNQDVLTIR